MQTKHSQSGFTLVEIAIVLVIIGLLLGGILKGQEMITQARIKNVMNDFNGITAAYFSYQDRYKAAPGDDSGAVTRWGTNFGAQNGNQDGTVGVAGSGYNGTPLTPAAVPNSSTTAIAAASENTNFWQHLRIAGFVAGPNQGTGSTSQPLNAVNGQIGVQTQGLGLNGLIVCSANIPDKIATAVDTQLDDQGSSTGSLRGQLQAGANPATGTAA
ncbi:MAG TPA: prepilin-type N-terminal cleavage/methylation domain-containing protein, partial [Burkholderiales bacterium]|nr:prepilin-type N-terminal cleavage/methylation domain-containing protein [Burkholderiales bacterium]